MSNSVEKIAPGGLGLIMVLCFLASLFLVGSLTAKGAGLSMDSLYYTNAARNIAKGNGINISSHSLTSEEFAPFTTWPPLYPVLLASGYNSDQDTVSGIPYFNIVLLSVTLFVLVLVVYELSGSLMAGILLAAMFLFYPITQITFSFAWSETLFFPLILSSYYFLFRNLSDKQGGNANLYIGTILLATAFYTRYAAAAFVFAAIIAQFACKPQSYRVAMNQAFRLGSLFVVLVLPLLGRNLLLVGHLSGADRKGGSTVSMLQDTQHMGDILITDFFGSYYIFGLFVLVMIIVVYYERHTISRRSRLSCCIPLIWVFSYLGFVLISRQMQSIDLDSRMMVVVFPFIIFFLAGLLPAVVGWNAGFLKIALVSMALVITSYHIDVYKYILESWVTDPRKAVTVNGIVYPSITDSKFMFIQDMKDSFKLEKDAYIFTDFSRPIVFNYFFPSVRVKHITGSRIVSLDDPELAGKAGLVVLTTPDMQSRFMGRTGVGKRIYNIRATPGKSSWIAIRLGAGDG